MVEIVLGQLIGERHAAALVIMDMRQSAGRKSPTARDAVGRGILVAPFGDERWSPQRPRHAPPDRASGARPAPRDDLEPLSGTHHHYPLSKHIVGEPAAARRRQED